MSSFLLLLHCPVGLAHFIWMICEMGGKWLYKCCFVGCCFQGFVQNSMQPFLCSSHLPFSPSVLLKWCDHTVVLTQLERIPVLFYQRNQISIRLLTCQ